MTRKELLLLVLAAGKGKPLSPIQLQKSLFLAETNCPNIVDGPPYDFVPHNYGPFCKDVYTDVESPTLADLIKVHRKAGRNWREYSATEQCVQFASELDVQPEVRSYIASLVDWVTAVPFDELVRAVYQKYPGYKVNSIFRG